eukprot:8661003-Pyramimonas_sp.AAC.1
MNAEMARLANENVDLRTLIANYTTHNKDDVRFLTDTQKHQHAELDVLSDCVAKLQADNTTLEQTIHEHIADAAKHTPVTGSRRPSPDTDARDAGGSTGAASKPTLPQAGTGADEQRGTAAQPPAPEPPADNASYRTHSPINLGPLGSNNAQSPYNVGGSLLPATVKESDRVRVPGFPKITGVSDWMNGVRKGFRNASGRPAQAYAFIM